MKSNLTLIVFGGRDYHDRAFLCAALNLLHRKRNIVKIIEGGANGADDLANQWASENNVECVSVHADWGKHGAKAGPIRNRQMAEMEGVDGAVGFPGGRGTANMVEQCVIMGISVWFPKGSNQAEM